MESKENTSAETNWTNHSDRQLDDDELLTVCRHCDDGKDYECKFCGARFHLKGRKNDHEAGCIGP